MIKHSINISPIFTLTKKETSKTKSPPQVSSARNTLGLIEITAPRMHLYYFELSWIRTWDIGSLNSTRRAAFVPTSYQKNKLPYFTFAPFSISQQLYLVLLQCHLSPPATFKYPTSCSSYLSSMPPLYSHHYFAVIYHSLLFLHPYSIHMYSRIHLPQFTINNKTNIQKLSCAHSPAVKQLKVKL